MHTSTPRGDISAHRPSPKLTWNALTARNSLATASRKVVAADCVGPELEPRHRRVLVGSDRRGGLLVMLAQHDDPVVVVDDLGFVAERPMLGGLAGLARRGSSACGATGRRPGSRSTPIRARPVTPGPMTGSASTCWPRRAGQRPPLPARALPPAGLRNELLPLLGPGHLDRLRGRARPPRQRGRQLSSLTRPRSPSPPSPKLIWSGSRSPTRRDLRHADRQARPPGSADRLSLQAGSGPTGRCCRHRLTTSMRAQNLGGGRRPRWLPIHGEPLVAVGRAPVRRAPARGDG